MGRNMIDLRPGNPSPRAPLMSAYQERQLDGLSTSRPALGDDGDRAPFFGAKYTGAYNPDWITEYNRQPAGTQAAMRDRFSGRSPDAIVYDWNTNIQPGRAAAEDRPEPSLRASAAPTPSWGRPLATSNRAWQPHDSRPRTPTRGGFAGGMPALRSAGLAGLMGTPSALGRDVQPGTPGSVSPGGLAPGGPTGTTNGPLGSPSALGPDVQPGGGLQGLMKPPPGHRPRRSPGAQGMMMSDSYYRDNAGIGGDSS
jgi:hypothetical protein